MRCVNLQGTTNIHKILHLTILNKEFCVCLFHLSFSYQKLYPEVKLTI